MPRNEDIPRIRLVIARVTFVLDRRRSRLPSWRRLPSCPWRSTTTSSSAKLSKTSLARIQCRSPKVSRSFLKAGGLEWGVDRYQLEKRYGNYFHLFLRTSEQADVTVRLEYRQAALGNYVMAVERYYPQAKGSYRSEFDTAGDEYLRMAASPPGGFCSSSMGGSLPSSQSFMWR